MTLPLPLPPRSVRYRRPMRIRSLVALLAVSLSLSAWARSPKKTPPPEPAPAAADSAPPAEADAMGGLEDKLPEGMTAGPAEVTLGSHAKLQLSEDAVFGNAKVAREILEQSGNLTSGKEQGIVLRDGATVIFDFDPVGYVKDDDKDALDADKMLASLRENQDAANVELRRLARPELEIAGWHVKPHYDEKTHNLEWAPLVKSKTDGKTTVNYNVRLLGRRGVMEAALLVAPDKFDAQLPWFRSLLGNYAYVAGEDYASFRQGDKISEYGLAALVTGGVVAVAAKSGLLGKIWKLLLVGLVAIGGAIKKLFGGGNKEPATVTGNDEGGAPPAA